MEMIMNVTQSIQTNPAKALELFTRLSETSDGSVKTRERLLDELKIEIESYAQIEEAQLLAALRKHKDTRSLANDAAAENRQVRKMLGEMEEMPKDSCEFLGQVKELRQAFQQHVQHEKKELLPALKKVLSDEQMQNLAHDMEAGRADADRQRQEEAEQHRAAAREERQEKQRQVEQDEHDKQQAEQRRIAAQEKRAQAERQAEQDEREKQERAEQRRLAAQEKREQGERQEEQARLKDQGEQAVAALRKSAANEAARQEPAAVGEGLRRLQQSLPQPQAADADFGRLTEYGQLWMDFGSTTAESTARASSAIGRCGSTVQLAQIQLRYATEIGQAWMEAGTRMVEISLRRTMRR